MPIQTGRFFSDTSKIKSVEQDNSVGQCSKAPLREAAPTGSQLHPSVTADPRRASAIIGTQTKWMNGTVLHYCFFQAGPYAVPKVQADAIREAFATWKQVGVGLSFQESKQLSEAEVRIGYSLAESRSASAVGRQVLQVPVNNDQVVAAR